jgi:3',5'-cyclic AMP phosphodiesterase CpdA
MIKPACLVIFSLAVVISVVAQPQHIHLSWNSIKKNATSTTIAVTWTDTVLYKGKVRFGSDSMLSLNQQAVAHYGAETRLQVYTSVLKKLNAGTRYFYQCGSDEKGWSRVYAFTTGPPAGSNQKFVTGVWGDTQDNEFNTSFEKTALITERMRHYPLHFTIHMGDIVNNGDNVNSWKNLYKTTEPVNASAPFMPVTGNHDVNNDTASKDFQQPFPVFYELSRLPRNQTDYSFNYGNTHFVAISSGHAKGAENQGNYRYAKGSPEYRWLEKDLAKARKDKNIRWIIMYMHHPPYSFGWSHVTGWQERITPFIDKYSVDLVMSGHRHVYERHRPIRNNKVLPVADPHVYDKPGGAVYITNGTAGGSPQGVGGKDMPSMIFTSPSRMYNYAIMTIEASRISYEVFDEKGEKVDYFTLLK